MDHEDRKTPPSAQPVDPAPGRPRWQRLLPLVLLLGLIVVGYQQGWHEALSLSNLIRARAELSAFIDEHYALGLLAFVLALIVVIALAIPGATALTVVAGLLFGWIVAGLGASVGSTIGTMIAFSVARTSLGQPLARRAGPRLSRLREGFERNAFNYVLFLRLIPLFPFWLVTLSAALLSVRFRTFILGAAIGVIPLALIVARIGEGLDEALLEHQQELEACLAAGSTSVCKPEFSLNTLITPGMLGALIALAALALVPVIVGALRKR